MWFHFQLSNNSESTIVTLYFTGNVKDKMLCIDQPKRKQVKKKGERKKVSVHSRNVNEVKILSDFNHPSKSKS